MVRENLPNITTDLTDGNLDTTVNEDLGDSITLIGTASRGPTNNPITVRQPQDAVDVFGSIDEGTLVQGFAEAYYAPGGEKDINLIRISNGNTASLDLYESPGQGLDDTTRDISGDQVPALRIESLYPGSIYNEVSFRMEGNDIIGYNPIDGQETVIPYDINGSTEGSVTDVKSFANAINVDPNLGSIVRAEANEIHTIFEVDIHEDWDYVDVESGSVHIRVGDLLETFDYNFNEDTDKSYVDLPSYGTDLEFSEVTTEDGDDYIVFRDSNGDSLGSISDEWPDSGYLKVYKENDQGEEYDVELIKYNGVMASYGSIGGDSSYATAVIEERGFAGTSEISHDNGDIVEFYIPIFPLPVSVTAGDGIDRILESYELDNVDVELDSAGKTEVDLPYPIQMTTNLSRQILDIDGNEDLDGDGEAKHIIENSFIGRGDGEKTVFQFTAYEPIDESTLEVKRTSSSGTTVEISKNTESDSNGWVLNSVGGGDDDKQAEIEITPAPSEGSIITVSYTSEKFDLTQLPTLSAVQASDNYTEYFAAGDKITFGTAQPADIKFVYPAKVTYREGESVSIAGGDSDEILISTDSSLEDDADDYGRIIGLDYYYNPEWVDLSYAQSLQGGSDGNNMSNSAKYKVLEEMYEELADHETDIVALLDTYVDDTKVAYDKETGLPTEVNAGFLPQFNEYLEQMLDGVNETFGIMSVSPAETSRAPDVREWYEKLINTNTIENDRAANVMQGLDARLIDVCAMELVVNHDLVDTAYITTGEAMLAGLTATLDPKNATTNESLGNSVVGTRYRLSSRQLDELANNRYVTARVRPGSGVVVTEGVTAAAPGSDWERRSTFRIVAAAMDVVRNIGEPFLGKGFNAQRKAALETGLTNGLTQMQEDGALQSYNFSIEQTPEEATQGIARVKLKLQPAFELRKINVTVKLSATAV